MNPFFSIIIPLFNQEKIFKRCLESLKAQTYGDFEALIINDGSTDNSVECITEFIGDDERFRIVDQGKNSSVLCVRITGLREAKGEYVLCLDIDDYLENNALELIHGTLAANPVDVLTYGLIENPTGKVHAPESAEDELEALLTCKTKGAVIGSVFAKRVTDKALPFIKWEYCNMAEDFYIKSIIYYFAESFATLEDNLYNYVIGGMSNSTATLSVEKLRKQLGFIEFAMASLREFLESQNSPKASLIDTTRFELITNTMWQYGSPVFNWRTIYPYFEVFDNDEYEDVFNWLFDVFVPTRVRLLAAKGEKK